MSSDDDDVAAGLRRLYELASQSHGEVTGVADRVAALVEELTARGLVDPRRVEAGRKRRQAAHQERPSVELAPRSDKYALTVLPEIDCASLLPICQGRCCKLQISLSEQDLDERILRWDYAQPYRLKKRTDGYCVHSDAQTRACTVYEQRPATCRTYDCREDRRIWLDFERRIPAP